MIRVYMPTFVIKERAGSRKEVEARSFSEATGLAVDKFVSYKRVFLPGEAAGGNNLVKVREQSKQNGQCMVWHGHLVLPPSESKYPPTPPRVSLSERRHVVQAPIHRVALPRNSRFVPQYSNSRFAPQS
ncbi:hypothetical protein BHE74_00027271 [Ensete ventricosum]|nr:hypothetical protein GW17_00039123 [Ensete ventricosum]RWW65457.1 hypothetical protein BHE74_00027271 [Ensete ventricosum]RZS05489.1 hypothetical protein BHM03_00036018 [Ensete ventricosum]